MKAISALKLRKSCRKIPKVRRKLEELSPSCLDEAMQTLKKSSIA